ncbi:hypothetical protein GUITHDRAFT_149823 [Guillardia theta CCMP2712]|uniref:Uncharacterized protein n=2 Tax=Guillardia theta TaxID=55529 RepID=L1K2T4_GUITC|nr:hypothetical protein GUITHDRAFT_149823 [Guillardia theta CCMP2712]EKX54678.1 hypothetical protein GUITHDRAFT_149823 [Guillardia theta CCMP2712]|mmetsp:Transcript_15312/g.51456  ORF Transcript_15312/g.51456 Transcript_15312/m.51456 type:complete len:185 (+) Transcript_15312:198-752(+)|eukprot:XP_005841658.1 hypothetical protein GUITHDRAFT_149823 [Guillardia theta CCMP2712]
MGNSTSRRNYVIAEIQSDIKLLMDTCPEHTHLDWNDVDCISHHSAVNALQNYALFEKLRVTKPKLWSKKDRRCSRNCARRGTSVRFSDSICNIPRKHDNSECSAETRETTESWYISCGLGADTLERSPEELSISNSMDSAATTVLALEDFFSDSARNINGSFLALHKASSDLEANNVLYPVPCS